MSNCFLTWPSKHESPGNIVWYNIVWYNILYSAPNRIFLSPGPRDYFYQNNCKWLVVYLLYAGSAIRYFSSRARHVQQLGHARHTCFIACSVLYNSPCRWWNNCLKKPTPLWAYKLYSLSCLRRDGSIKILNLSWYLLPNSTW